MSNHIYSLVCYVFQNVVFQKGKCLQMHRVRILTVFQVALRGLKPVAIDGKCLVSDV